MMFSSVTDIDLEKRIVSLSKELHTLKREMSNRGNALYVDGHQALADRYSDMVGIVSEMLPDLKKGAREIEISARKHPAATSIIGFVVLGLLTAALFRKR